MLKKRVFLLAVLSFLGLTALIGGLAVLVKHEPAFYRRALVTPGKDRKDLSTAFMGRFFKLAGHWNGGGKEEWDMILSEAQLNSYFEEDFIRLGDAEALRKLGLAEPRIVLENDRLRLAFRYGQDPWSTVISYDLKLWLAPKDINVVCVEILGRHAGALPVSAQTLLNEISEVAAKRGIEVTWYRHQGNPVALVRFQSGSGRPSAQLQRLNIKQGMMTLGGISLESLPNPSSGLRKTLTPMAN